MNIYVHGHCRVGKKACFSVMVYSGNVLIHSRVVPSMLKSAYNAELAAIKYAMLAVVNKDDEFNIKTSISHLPHIFSKSNDGSWFKKSTNDLVNDVRELSASFAKFTCVYDDSEIMHETKELIKAVSVFECNDY